MRKFDIPDAPIALAATALDANYPTPFVAFVPASASEPFERACSGTVAIVRISGPLMHHRDCFFDSYDAIRARVTLALASDAHAVALLIDSPGGVVSGAFDAS